MIHIVTQGETLADIAQRYHTSKTKIIKDNQLVVPEYLTAGQALIVDHHQIGIQMISDQEYEWLFPEFATVHSRNKLREKGYLVVVMIDPTDDAVKNVDWKMMKQTADKVIFACYEYGDTSRSPECVVSLEKIRQWIGNAVAFFPAEKIWIGVSSYGYDWILPFVKEKTKGRKISQGEAVRLAGEHQALIRYDEKVQAPHFHYVAEGMLHEVWFEDARSIQAKADLAKEFGLGGIRYWDGR